MAANPNSIPFLSDHAYRSRYFQVLTSTGQPVCNPIYVGTWNLQDKCFVKDSVQGLQQDKYNSSSPRVGQVLYTISKSDQTIQYKYKDASGRINERTVVLKSAANLILAQVKKEVLSSIRKEDPNFIVIPVGNSPFDTNESVENYKQRKREQISWIMAAIDAGEDIINLQEIDFLSSRGEADESQKKFAESLYKELKKRGYDYVISWHAPEGFSQQPLAVIYNNKKFELMHQHSTGIFPNGNKTFRGYETRFKVLDDSLGPVKMLVNTNLHLEYGYDYREEIQEYQKKFEQLSGVMHIMAGDCNNYQNQNLQTALGSWYECTNIGRSHDGGLIPYHEGSHHVKAYDVYFVTAPGGHKVQTAVNMQRSQQFVLANGTIQLCNSTDNHFSCTRMGERWRRGVDILEEKAKELLRSDSNMTVQQLSENDEVKRIIEEKEIQNYLHPLERVKSLISRQGLTPSAPPLYSFHSPGNPNPSQSLYPQIPNLSRSISSSSSSSTRGRVLFIRSTDHPNRKLSTPIYEQLLASQTGTYDKFLLIDPRGTIVRGGVGMHNTVYVYPGNPYQALHDPNKLLEPQNFKKTTNLQRGENLAKIAQQLTEKGCQALPLPTTFTARDQNGKVLPEEKQRAIHFWDFKQQRHMANRYELAEKQLQCAEKLLEEGKDIVFFVVPRENGSAFQQNQYVATQNGVNYQLAFWGGIEPGSEAGNLPAIYAYGVQGLANGQRFGQINVSDLSLYMNTREKSGSGFSLFGGFSKKEKVDAAAKLIQAIIHYNLNHSMELFEGEALTPRERDALNEEKSQLKAAVDATLAKVDDKDRKAILDWIVPDKTVCSHNM